MLAFLGGTASKFVLAKVVLTLLKILPSDQISCLKRKRYSPPRVCDCPHVGLSEKGAELGNGSSLDQPGLHSSASQIVGQPVWGTQLLLSRTSEASPEQVSPYGPAGRRTPLPRIGDPLRIQLRGHCRQECRAPQSAGSRRHCRSNGVDRAPTR